MTQDKRLPEEPVTTKVGSKAFRALNFELYAVRTSDPPPIMSTFPHNFRYQKPTPKLRMLSYVGTACFVGYFSYLVYQKQHLTAQKNSVA